MSTMDYRRQHRPLTAESVTDNTYSSSRRRKTNLAADRLRADTQVALATNQLKDQVKEGISFWRRFLDEYSKEVSGIKRYVGSDILEKIWRIKVKSNDKSKEGKENSQQFERQNIKLKACLKQVGNAIRSTIEAWPLEDSDYDSRRHHLKKVRANVKLLVDLNKDSPASEAACKELLNELVEMEKLIGGRASTGNTLHQVKIKTAEKPWKGSLVGENTPVTEEQAEFASNDEDRNEDNSKEEPEAYDRDDARYSTEKQDAGEQDDANDERQDRVDWPGNKEQGSPGAW